MRYEVAHTRSPLGRLDQTRSQWRACGAVGLPGEEFGELPGRGLAALAAGAPWGYRSWGGAGGGGVLPTRLRLWASASLELAGVTAKAAREQP